jgi:uncharacterized protein (DUF1800 family)
MRSRSKAHSITRCRHPLLTFFLLASSADGFALSQQDTQHLLGRTGFSASAQDILRFRSLDREQAVQQLLDGLDTPQLTLAPAYVREPRPHYWSPPRNNAQGLLVAINERDQLQTWWLQEMVRTPAPFAEWLTLFWHGLLVSRFDNTHVTAPFADQLALFRSQGSRSFRTLLRQLLNDPMMLTGLDNVHNNRHQPNENLARELLELFTLGVSNYSERDVKHVARVLAGHGVDFDNGWRYRFDADAAVAGEKIVLGQRINGAGDAAAELDALVEILLQQAQTSRRLARRFYHELVALDANEAEIERLAAVLRQHDYQLRPFLRELLLSEPFWDVQNRGALVKSPIELVVGFARETDMQLYDYRILRDYATALGQEPFMAPSVAGWRGGNGWINSKTLVDRQRVVARLWQAARQPYGADQNGLRILYASENKGEPMQFEVMADDLRVAMITATLGIDTRVEQGSDSAGSLKPMWESSWIPAQQLPSEPRSITITARASSVASHLFVNWIEWHGRRYTPYLAQWQQAPGTTCATDAPLGSFYCNLSLRFDLDSQQQVSPPSLADRRAPLNSNLEYGTGRLRFLPNPAWQGVSTITTLAAAAAQDSGVRRHDIVPLLPLPVSASDSTGNAGTEFEIATLDPAYNLK